MKIRTDFVTNSSSSSFVAVLQLELDNGNTIKASKESSVGDGDFICRPRTEYLCRQYEDIGTMKGKYIFDSRSSAKIISGTYKLMCHTSGEESYKANPTYLLRNHISYELGLLLDNASEKHDEMSMFNYLRSQNLLADYTDESLHTLVDFLLSDGIDGNDTEIIQTLYEDGSLTLSIKNGNDMFNTSDAFQVISEPSKYIELFSSNFKTKKEAKEQQKAQEAAEKAREEERLKQEVKNRSEIIMDAIRRASHEDDHSPTLTLQGKSFAFTHAHIDDNYRIEECMHTLGLQQNNDQIDFLAIRTILEQRGASLTSVYSKTHDYLVCEDPSKPLKTEWPLVNIPGKSGNISYQMLWNAVATTEVLSASEIEEEQKRIEANVQKRKWENDTEEINAFLATIKTVLDDEKFLSKIIHVGERETTMRAYLKNSPCITIREKVFSQGYPDNEFYKHFREAEFANAILRRGGKISYETSKIAQSCIDNYISYSTTQMPEYGDREISVYALLQAILNTPELSFDEYIEMDPSGLLGRRVEKVKQDQHAQTRQRAEEKKQQAEETRKQRDIARRQRVEEKQRHEEELRIKHEAALKLEEEKKHIKEEQKEKEKLNKERLAAEAKAQKERERQEAIANATILYAPGQEPENIQRRIRTLFEKLDAAYPDRKISGLYKDHKKWGETVTELYRFLGYVDSKAFLEAYGYTVKENKMGRTVSVDPVAITLELQHRYPDGTGNLSISQIKEANPDIPWKTLANNSREYFGMTLSEYLRKLHTIDISSIKSPITTTEEVHKADAATHASAPAGIQEAPATDHEPESIEQQCLEVISTLCENLTEAPADMVAAVAGCSEAELSKAIERLVSDGKIVRTKTGHLRPVIIQDIQAKDEPKEAPDEQPSMSVPVVSQPEEEGDEPDSSGTTEFSDKEETDASLPADDTNELTESDKKYLAAILHLGQSGATVKAIDIAAYFNVTKASVSYAMKRLSNKGYIYYGDDKAIYLADGIDESLLSSTKAMVIDSSLAVELSDSEKKYIWAIEQLQKKNGFVRAIDIADLLAVTKASVSYSIKKLREKGAVTQLPNGSLAIVTADYPPAALIESNEMAEAASLIYRIMIQQMMPLKHPPPGCSRLQKVKHRQWLKRQIRSRLQIRRRPRAKPKNRHKLRMRLRNFV